MDAMQKSSVSVSSRPSQEKDFPYFRRLFNSIVVALLAASFIPLLVIGGGMYYHTVSILEQKTLAALDAEISEHRETIDHFLTERTIDLKILSSNSGVRLSHGSRQPEESVRHPPAAVALLHAIWASSTIRAGTGRTSVPMICFQRTTRKPPGSKRSQQREFYVSDVFLGFRNDPHFIIAVKQMTGEGFWILRATVDTDYFERLVARDSEQERRRRIHRQQGRNPADHPAMGREDHGPIGSEIHGAL